MRSQAPERPAWGPRSRSARVILAVLAALLLGAPASGEDELDELREAIADRKAQLEAYESEEQGLFEAIESVDRAARALRNEAQKAAREASEALRAQKRLTAEAQGLEAKLKKTRESLGKRAVALYKAGEVGPLRWVFSEGSLADRVARVQAVQLLVDHDDELIQRSEGQRQELLLARAGAAEAAERRDEARKKLELRSRELEAERRGKRTLLVRVRQDRARERALLNELEAAARELESTLDDLRGSPGGAPAGRFAAARGKLNPPVAGGITRAFGRVVDAEYRTETFRKGVDFQVALGEPVYAIAEGEVRFADWFRGYGRMVIIDHGGDYFTVSGHLDQVGVEVGQSLAAGDAIGSAGETGSLLGPLLYFEIRRGAEAQDPAEWLRLAPSL